MASDCVKKPVSPRVVSVRDTGAKGDGRTDDTAHIQSAIDRVAAAGGGTVLVPNGAYMVNAATKGVALKSNVTLKLEPNAVLRVIPNSLESYTLLTIADAAYVTIDGGTLEGDRGSHGGKTGEWGMGVRFGAGSKHVTIANVKAMNMWGDGFYVAGAVDVTFCNVVAENNRRQGISIVDVDGLLVTNSVFKQTRGTRPSAGIDFEPNDASQRIINVHIENSKFIDNEGPAILIAGKKAAISKVAITRNTITGERPILIEDAPGVKDKDICRNRYVTFETEPPSGLTQTPERRQLVRVQIECGDPSVFQRRGKKKKSK